MNFEVIFSRKQGPEWALAIKAPTQSDAIVRAARVLVQCGESLADYKKPCARLIGEEKESA